MFLPRLNIITVAILCSCAVNGSATDEEKRGHIRIRGVYGGVPVELLEADKMLADYGINAIFMGSGRVNAERLALLKKHKAQVFAEFNTMHVASYLKDHPDAAPIGVDGQVCPAPQGWQGICPTHRGYRKFRMDAFRKVLSDFEIDGIWLDYHHSHASWERAVPDMPDTCFCQRCVAQFARQTKTNLPNEDPPHIAKRLLGQFKEKWVQWRCDVFTDWVREFRSIIDETRPEALLGTFHCPWTDAELDGALRNKLAIDLKAQEDARAVRRIAAPRLERLPYALARQLLGVEGGQTVSRGEVADVGAGIDRARVPVVIVAARREAHPVAAPDGFFQKPLEGAVF